MVRAFLAFSLLLLTVQVQAEDLWEKAFKAKEEQLLGNEQLAERILESLKKDLVDAEKKDLDWALLKWVEEEIQVSRNRREKKIDESASELMTALTREAQIQPKAATPWYRSKWFYAGAGLSTVLLVIHQKERGRGKRQPEVIEGFVP